LIREIPGGIELSVRVIPRAKKTSIGGTRDGVPLVRLAAPPVDDAANDCLVGFIAQLLRRPRRDVRIIAGERSRLKRLSIEGISAEAAGRLLGV
jgi:uncharacterized protein (TIGR00251 family)